MVLLENAFSTWGNSRVRLFLSTLMHFTLLVAYGHSWWGNASTCAEKKPNPRIASCGKDTFHGNTYNIVSLIHPQQSFWFFAEDPLMEIHTFKTLLSSPEEIFLQTTENTLPFLAEKNKLVNPVLFCWFNLACIGTLPSPKLEFYSFFQSFLYCNVEKWSFKLFHA